MDLLGISCESGNDNPALTENGRSLSYSELDGRVTAAARRLWALGARPGARVAVVMAPSTDWVVTWHALQRLRAVVAPLDHRATTTETEDRLAALDPALVLRDPS